MRDYKSLTHTRRDCKYHIVFIPKKRKKQIYGVIRMHLGEILHELAKRRGVVHRRRVFNAGSYPNVHKYTAKVCSIECSWLSER